MRIHEEPTDVPRGELHYNMEREKWETKPLLEVRGGEGGVGREGRVGGERLGWGEWHLW